MAVKLKLILEPVPWLLVAKTIIFGTVWYFLPFWVFLLVSLYFYFSPAFQSGRFLPLFLVILYLASTNEPSIWLAILFSLIFYLTIGIKDLIFIDRKTPYTILIYTLLLLLFINFWKIYPTWNSKTLLRSILLPITFFFLTKDYLTEWGEFEKRRKNLILGLASFFVWQFSLAILFLPLNQFYSPLILFVISLIFLEIMPDYLNNTLTMQKKLIAFSLLFVLITLIVGLLEVEI